jgi:hypothetical protein
MEAAKGRDEEEEDEDDGAADSRMRSRLRQCTRADAAVIWRSDQAASIHAAVLDRMIAEMESSQKARCASVSAGIAPKLSGRLGNRGDGFVLDDAGERAPRR